MSNIYAGGITWDGELSHIPNRESLGAVDHLEAFTPAPSRLTAKEVIAAFFREDWPDAVAKECASALLGNLRAAGYDIIQRVSQGNKHV